MQKEGSGQKIAKKTKKGFSWREYVSYLGSEKWRRKRLAVGFDRNFECEMCHNYCRDRFEIHHKTYRNIFKEPLCDLVLLCPECHRKIEAQKRRDRKWRKINDK